MGAIREESDQLLRLHIRLGGLIQEGFYCPFRPIPSDSDCGRRRENNGGKRELSQHGVAKITSSQPI